MKRFKKSYKKFLFQKLGLVFFGKKKFRKKTFRKKISKKKFFSQGQGQCQKFSRSRSRSKGERSTGSLCLFYCDVIKLSCPTATYYSSSY